VSRNRVEKRPQAIDDLATFAVYLAEASFESLATMSEMGAAGKYNDPALGGVRVWRVTGFPNHLIFYRPIAGGVEVIRVLHAKRDIESLLSGRD
jgi:toxin ParE1/3/4